MGNLGHFSAKDDITGIFLLIILMLGSRLFCGTSGLNSEGFALLAFKAAVLDDPRQALQNWSPNDDTPCNWNGIRCNADQSVEQVSLSRQRLLGTLFGDLSNLTNLRRLNLHDNHFFGPLPSALFDNPSLKSLYLFNNNFSGIVPSNIDQLVSIQHLDISANDFVGGIPPRITGCSNLQTLIMNGNKFSGPIPPGLGNALEVLRSLDLSSNELDGEIPSELGNLTSLQVSFNLSNNHFTGPIPESLGSLPSTVSFDLSNNNLTGPIPSNGILKSQSASAFLNNPGLCGHPLATACSPSPATSPASASSPSYSHTVVSGKAGLSTKAVIAIVAGDSVGIVVIVLIFMYCLLKGPDCQKPKKGADSGNNSGGSSPSHTPAWAALGCFPGSKDGSEASEKVEQGELTRLDDDVKFDLEELLRASAYMLGKSGVGIVYKAHLEEGVAVAVRRLGGGGADTRKQFEREVQLIGRIRHPNIVSLRAYYWAVDEKLLILDFVPNGSLAAALHARKADAPVSTPLSWPQRLKVAQGAARGLAYIHSCGGKQKLVHKDIKSSNILLDENMDARISDLGLARLRNLAGGGVSSAKQAETGLLSGGIGRRAPPATVQQVSSSSSYYPPEAAQAKKKPSQKWDVYSFGVVLTELLTGRSPTLHFASTETNLATWVRETMEERKPISEILDPHLCSNVSKLESEYIEVLQVALLCTEPSAELRPTMSLVSHSLQQVGRKLEICVSE